MRTRFAVGCALFVLLSVAATAPGGDLPDQVEVR